MKKIDPLKGMRDLFEPELKGLRAIEDVFRTLALARGYGEIRTPLVEATELFARGLGDASSVIGKEMYTFPDRKGLSLALRPEGTASVVRATITKGLRQSEPYSRLFYMGPMFRYERPQKGRQRQFHQLGLEVFGLSEPSSDCEVIAAVEAYFKVLGLAGKTTLLLNSIGCKHCRPPYLRLLETALAKIASKLCPECKARQLTNPLRVFDCKNDSCRTHGRALPKTIEHLCEACAAHWRDVKAGLDSLRISYTIDPTLVRGLDYYTRTAFEWRAAGLGSQDAIGGGGRYDGLVELLGGPATPAIGVAIGVERLVIALEAAGLAPVPDGPLVAILPLDSAAQLVALDLQTRLLEDTPLRVAVNLSGASLKTQLRQASRDGASYALILGETERADHTVVVKNLTSFEQKTIAQDALIRDHSHFGGWPGETRQQTREQVRARQMPR